MQFLLKRSKLVISVVLSCGLIIAWLGVNTDVVTKPQDSSYRRSRIQPSPHVDTFWRTSLGVNNIWRPSSPQVDTLWGTTSHTDTVWSSIRDELKMDHNTQSLQVQAEIRKLLADRDKLNSILKAAVPYIYFIHQQTRAHDLPTELVFIPFIESEFNPNDRSKRGATGLWQLMPGTARELGVKVKKSYDGRRNVPASTKAALLYFRDLGNLFKGNWYLAIAAYDCGQVKVAKVVKRTGSKNFWKLPLPKETKHYVPKLLAVAAIIKDSEKYGIELPHVENQPYFTELKVSKPVSLEKVAKSSGISVKTLTALNPDYKHQVIPIKGAYSLLVPTEKSHSVKELLSDRLIISHV